MRYPERARGLVLVDAALGLTPTATPAWLQPQWVREILVSLTVTNPLMTRTLLQSLLAQKDRALPEYVDILQLPMTLRGSTPALADWLLYFTGRRSRRAERRPRGLFENETPDCYPVGRTGYGDAFDASPRSARRCCRMRPLRSCPALGHIPQIEDPDAFNDALLKTLGKL